MLDVLASLPSPSRIQAVSATDDPSVAQAWYDSFQGTGVEGVVAKQATSTYRPGRSTSWRKVRHSETMDCEVIGFTGSAARPRALAVRLPDGRTALSQTLGAPLAGEVARLLAGSAPAGRARTARGEAYAVAASGLVVEVLAGTTRHSVVTVTRLR